MRTIRFADVKVASKKEIFLRTGQTFVGQHFSGDRPVGDIGATTLQRADALERQIEQEMANKKDYVEE